MFVTELIAVVRCAGCRESGSLLCARCSDRIPSPGEVGNVPDLDGVVARWAYEGAARKLLLDLKVGRKRGAADALGRGIAEAIARVGSHVEALTWVPARRRDIRLRGFDHAELIARALALRTELPCRPLLVRTSQRVPDQVGLSRTARSENLRDAFESTGCSGRIGLVDDLLTTGATASACASALRAAGAGGVQALVACRA